MKHITIVVPVWNEEKNIPTLANRINSAFQKADFSYDILFVDDHSTDATTTAITKLQKKFPVSLLIKQGEKGKAFSLCEGIRKAQGDIVAILDADLQYPPEAIPEMASLLNNHVDIVVANRIKQKTSFARKFISTSFKKFFGNFLFGLNHDIQAGLKVFKRDICQHIEYHPSSGWTFDLEFLLRASEAGFGIENYDVEFSERAYGKSKVSYVKTSLEIGLNALALKTRPLKPAILRPLDNTSMRGAGIGYKKKKYITHSTLSHTQSALTTITTPQRVFIFLLLLASLVALSLRPLPTLQVFIGILSTVYFIDTVFNFFLVMKSLHVPQEITSTEEEIRKIDTRQLPIYSILCPLYKEAHVIPQFLESIEKLDYPKNKLDVLLLLEEDDADSIAKVERMYLPSYVRSIVVPHSMPKTKPKACNYGLSFAKGEYLVIYDAEDAPDPLQLKKAFLAFQKVGANVLCLQAKLNYYNPHQNLLTRFFTAEYSLWFDVTLTGLQAAGTSIPLGGTSNHFRTKDLFTLQGWDPFNVTEDADLGIRLFKRGYQTAIIDSVTLEEANSNVFNWIRQRSRWIKGYMQTYLVHTRQNFGLTHRNFWHSLLFHLTIGGKIAFILINPFLWLATISYFVLYRFVGPTIESLYPSYVFYMALISLVFGNFMFVYYYMIGCAKREQWSLIKYVYLIPFYWLLISWSGFIAFYQLIFKPHYWEKTIHGLHLKNLDKKIADIAVADEHAVGVNISFFKRFAKTIGEKKHLYIGGLLLISGTMGANVLNFVFSIYLGRTLRLEDFGELSLFTSLMYFTSIPLGSFSSTISHNIAYLFGKGSKKYAQGYLRYIFRRSILVGVFLSLAWFACTPFLSKFFQTESYIPIIMFSPLWLINVASSNFSGYLAGTLSFGKKGAVLFTEAATRLLFAFILVSLKQHEIIFLSIVISTTISVIVSWFLVREKEVEENILPQDKKFNLLFFITSICNGISLITFLTLDVVLVKHFLTPVAAGEYGLLSLIGKMTYFLGSLFVPFMIPLISHNDGANKTSKNTFLLLFATTTGFSLLSFVFLGILGPFTVPLIFGTKTLAIVGLLTPYVLSMSLFTISQPISNYFQAKEKYSFAFVGLGVAILQITLTSLFHRDLQQVVWVMLATSFLNLLFMVFLFLVRKKMWFVNAAIRDFFDLFAHQKKRVQKEHDANSYKKILILNWRDTKHKWAGGAEVYLHELAKRWVQEGNQVTIFCGNGGKSSRNEVIDGVEIIRRGGFYMVYIWAFIYFIFKFRGKYDILIDSENGIPFFTPLYAREKIFLLIHHVHQEVFRKSLKFPFANLALFLEAKLMPTVYRNIQVITVSPSSKEEIIKHSLTKKDPIVIYNGVDLATFKPLQKAKKPLILYVGRLQYYKSLNVFIKAAKIILEKVPDAQFVIAGEGGQKTKLEAYAKRLGMNENIQFVGWVSHEEKIKLLQKAWVFVNPSLMEGWGITTIEANACGTPAVASDVPGLKDSVKNGETGILVTYGSAELFAEAIYSIITNGTLKNKLSKNALSWASEFDWNKSAQRFLTEIQQNEDSLEFLAVENQVVLTHIKK